MMKFLLIKPPQKNEYSIANSQALFSSLLTKTPSKGFMSMFKKEEDVRYSFNFISVKQSIYFVAGATEAEYPHLKNQILAQFGKSDILEYASFDELLKVNYENFDFREIVPAKAHYFPIKQFDATETDPLSSLLSSMSRSADPNAFFWIQIILKPAGSSWQSSGVSRISKLQSAETVSTATQAEIALIQEKIKYHGFETNIRIITDGPGSTIALQNAFIIFSRPNGNKFNATTPGFLRHKKVVEAIQNHNTNSSYILNTLEISTIWHIPNREIALPNIVWGKRFALDTPDNLPIAFEGMSEEQKKDLTFIGKTSFKNKDVIYGIKSKDRLRHVYIVGKTGSGKSWLINNMAIEDIRKGAGIAVLDPHGDAIDSIMDFIPKSRINDVCYFNPADPDYAYPLNILEVYNSSQKELVVSGIIGIFYKLYAHSWGPRMEHILRNVLFTLVEGDNATLVDIVRVLNDKKYRNNLLKKIDNPLIHSFWRDEFDSMSEKFANEAVAPILNKVGQFVTSPSIRKVIGYPKSKVNMKEIMDNKKIFLCDLSQGKIGEDNATLLGSMLITQIQICAMNRAFIPEDQRVPFYLYVDEFQNFATSSFTKILSEARKYKLGLTLANQYITQIDEQVMGSIFGNIGSITAFNIGAKDADIMYKEFGSEIEAEDLTTMNRFQMLTRITIDGSMSKAFSGYSLTLPKNVSGHREKIIEQSRKRYGLKLDKNSGLPKLNVNSDGQVDEVSEALSEEEMREEQLSNHDGSNKDSHENFLRDRAPTAPSNNPSQGQNLNQTQGKPLFPTQAQNQS